MLAMLPKAGVRKSELVQFQTSALALERCGSASSDGGCCGTNAVCQSVMGQVLVILCRSCPKSPHSMYLWEIGVTLWPLSFAPVSCS